MLKLSIIFILHLQLLLVFGVINILSPENIQEILFRHHKARQWISLSGFHCKDGTVFPRATDMHVINWDNALAGRAENFLQHMIDTKRNTSGGLVRKQSGITEYSDFGLLSEEEIIKKAFDSRVTILCDKILWTRDPYESDMLVVDGAVQMIWAKTTRIGCATARWGSWLDEWVTTIICQYDPPLERGQKVYSI